MPRTQLGRLLSSFTISASSLCFKFNRLHLVSDPDDQRSRVGTCAVDTGGAEWHQKGGARSRPGRCPQAAHAEQGRTRAFRDVASKGSRRPESMAPP